MMHARYPLLIAAAALAYFAPNIGSGGVHFPLDILHHQQPFSATVPEALKPIRNPHLSDLVTMIYPWVELFRGSGTVLPLWNTYSFCGSPFLANGQSGILFPLTWLYRVLPIGAASFSVAVGKLMFCGIFAFLFYRKRRFDDLACFLGALTYMFCGHVIVWLGYPTAYCLIILPFLFWSIEKFLQTEKTTDLIWISIAFGLLFLGGGPQTAFVVALASGIYFIVRAQPNGLSYIRIYCSFAAAGIFGLCLAAPQIFPFLEYLGEGAASQLRGTSGWKHYPWFTFLSWAVPRFFGDLRDGNFWGFSSLLGEAIYVGAIPLMLAAVGAALGKKDRFYWGVVAVFLVGFLGLYLPFTQKLYQRIPLLANLDNNKLVLLVVFGLISFSVVGLHEMLQAGGRVRRLLTIWFVSVCFWTQFVLFGFFFFRLPLRELHMRSFVAREAAILVVVLVVASSILWLWRYHNFPPRQAASLLVALTLVDLFRVWINYYPSFPSEYLRPHSSAVDFLQANSTGGRFFGLGASMPPEISILYGLEDARGIDGHTPRRYYQVLEKIDPEVHDLLARLRADAPRVDKWTGSTLFYRSLKPVLDSNDPQTVNTLKRLDYWSNDISRIASPGLFSVLGVRYVLAPKGNTLPASAGFRLIHSSDAEVWENPDVLPGAFVSTRPIFVSDDQSALERISDPGFLLEKSAVICLDQESIARTETGSSTTPELIPVQVSRQSLHRVDLSATTRDGGWLVLSDLFYPGWQAFVDGRPTAILKANFLFRGIRLPPGDHQVSFRFRPASFYYGVALSVFALMALFLIGVYSDRTKTVQYPER